MRAEGRGAATHCPPCSPAQGPPAAARLLGAPWLLSTGATPAVVGYGMSRSRSQITAKTRDSDLPCSGRRERGTVTRSAGRAGCARSLVPGSCRDRRHSMRAEPSLRSEFGGVAASLCGPRGSALLRSNHPPQPGTLRLAAACARTGTVWVPWRPWCRHRAAGRLWRGELAPAPATATSSQPPPPACPAARQAAPCDGSNTFTMIDHLLIDDTMPFAEGPACLRCPRCLRARLPACIAGMRLASTACPCGHCQVELWRCRMAHLLHPTAPTVAAPVACNAGGHATGAGSVAAAAALHPRGACAAPASALQRPHTHACCSMDDHPWRPHDARLAPAGQPPALPCPPAAQPGLLLTLLLPCPARHLPALLRPALRRPPPPPPPGSGPAPPPPPAPARPAPGTRCRRSRGCRWPS